MQVWGIRIKRLHGLRKATQSDLTQVSCSDRASILSVLTHALGILRAESDWGESQTRRSCRILRSSMDGGYPEVHLRLPLALLERHTTATAESANNINTSRSAALPDARLP